MKTSVSIYSYGRALSKDFTMVEAIDHAKATGFDGIEFLHGFLLEGKDAAETAKILGDKCREAGLEIYSYNGGVNFMDENFDEQIKDGKELIDCAVILGAKAVRCDTIRGIDFAATENKGMKAILAKVSEGISILADYAAEKGINLMVENHGMIMQDSIIVEKLINKVGKKNYGALVDIGNFMCADETPVSGVGRMGRYAMHVHMKDFHFKSGNEVFLPTSGWFTTRGGNYLRGAMLGHGVVPVFQCVKILKQYKYDGAISLEFEGMENPIEAIEEGYRVLRKTIELVG